MVGWDPLLYPDPTTPTASHSKLIPAKGGTGSNYVQYQNAEIDALCAKGTAVVDQAERKKIYDASRKSCWRTCRSRRSSVTKSSSASRTACTATNRTRTRRSIRGTPASGRRGRGGVAPHVRRHRPTPPTPLPQAGRGLSFLGERWSASLLNRLGQSALLLLGVSVIGFALMHLAPGGPLAVYTLNPTVTAQDIERVKHQFGLDQPVSCNTSNGPPGS